MRTSSGRYTARIEGDFVVFLIGLAAASGHAPVGSTSTAAGRLGLRDDDRAPVES